MKKFELYNPIRMVFGNGEFNRLGELARNYGTRPLVVFGRSHARETGLLDRALKILKSAKMEPVVFEGVEPNPRVRTCEAAASVARDNKCDLVIGIGGGSVMDASKVIAFGVYTPGEIWNHIAFWRDGYKPVEKALPIVLASTLAATGSEGDCAAVITSEETMEKAGVITEVIFPKVSIVDPELTLTVPLEYTLDGAIDMILHVLESYFNGDDSSPFSDRCTEAFVVEAMLSLADVLEDSKDMNARSQLSYLGAIALHGFINRPRGGAFPMHSIEHPLSAHFDVSHGRGLAMILPRWLRHISRSKPNKKIIQFGERVFGMDLETVHLPEAVDRVIDRLVEWLQEVGAYYYMEDLGIPNDPDKFCEMAENAIRIYGGKKGLIDGVRPLSLDDVVEIYKSCIRPGAPVEVSPSIEESMSVEDQLEEEEEAETEDSSVQVEDNADRESDADVEVEIMEEIIVLQEGEPLPEGFEGEYVIIEEVIEEETDQETS